MRNRVLASVQFEKDVSLRRVNDIFLDAPLCQSIPPQRHESPWSAKKITLEDGDHTSPKARHQVMAWYVGRPCAEGTSPAERVKCFKTPAEAEQLRVEESDLQQAGVLQLEHERPQKESVGPNAKRDRRLKSESTKWV